MATLGVNIDHVATLRQQRHTVYPDPVQAAFLCELGGADSITVHLRQDRRHIQDQDVRRLKEMSSLPLNLEMAATSEMIQMAQEIRPHAVCMVPEKRLELTTEGGLNVLEQKDRLSDAIASLSEKNIVVSLFVDPDLKQISAAKEAGAPCVEIHTGRYCNAEENSQGPELQRVLEAIEWATSIGLICHAGHGLHYQNIHPLARHPKITEFNIGHAIIARAVFVGLAQAVRDMKFLLGQAA